MWNEGLLGAVKRMVYATLCLIEQCMNVWTSNFTTSLMTFRAYRKRDCVTFEMADKTCISFKQKGASDITGHLPITSRRCATYAWNSERSRGNAWVRAVEIPWAKPATVPHKPKGEQVCCLLWWALRELTDWKKQFGLCFPNEWCYRLVLFYSQEWVLLRTLSKGQSLVLYALDM